MPKIKKRTNVRSTGSKAPGKKTRKDSPTVKERSSAGFSESAKRKQAPRSRKRGGQDVSVDDSFKERTVSARTASHWKPIDKTSQALLIQTIDSAIIAVLSQTSSVSYSDVQDMLNSLKRRILENSKTLKAPVTKRPKFSTMETACQKLERDTLEASKLEEQLSEMVEDLTRTVDEKEEILEKLEKENENANTSIKQAQEKESVFLPEQYEDKLGIPNVMRTRSRTKISAFSQAETNPQISEILSAIESEGLVSVQNFATQLADFVALLPTDLQK